MKSKIINFFKKISIKTLLPIVGVLVVILTSMILLYRGSTSSNQSVLPTPAGIYFDGEYRIGDGEWKPIVKGEHISSTMGDVTLKGNFHVTSPGGEYIGLYSGSEYIGFYTNHINLTFCEKGKNPHTIDNENPLLGKYACGTDWTIYAFSSGKEAIEIVIKNPHSYGNENAIDEMLSSVAFWMGTDSEKNIMEEGDGQRNVGLLFIIGSIIFLGTAIFSTLIHVKNSKYIWLLGAIILFAGIYYTYSSKGISFKSELIIFNTSILGISMMLYMFFISVLIASLLKNTSKIGQIVVICLGIIDTVLFVLPMMANVFFYDTWLYWVILQGAINAFLTICIIKEITCANKKQRLILSSAFLPLIAFGLDAIATKFGLWQGGIASRCVFVILFAVATVVLLRIIPKNINAVAKSKELEAEKISLKAQLTESRVATMMSQIRPHFIYNTLGSIEELCELDPHKAGELVHDFAKYLRGNFSELDNIKPIPMSQEMEHLYHYINIEKVRFSDMTFIFEINSCDFAIPALTVQPIVENAIKHGLMKLPKGGTVKIKSYETDESYCVLVEDDGVGFDTELLLTERKHVGIRNIRGRLEAMANGRLEIESEIDKGTRVLITIPKEKEK